MLRRSGWLQTLRFCDVRILGGRSGMESLVIDDTVFHKGPKAEYRQLGLERAITSPERGVCV